MKQESKDQECAKKRAAADEEKKSSNSVKKEKKRRKSVDTDCEEEVSNIEILQSLRSQVDAILKHRNDLQKQLDVVNDELDEAATKLSQAINSFKLNTNNSSPDYCKAAIYDYQHDKASKSPKNKTILHYYYGGRSGILDLVGDVRVILEVDLMNGLLPLKVGTTDEDIPTTNILVTQYIGCMQYFHPATHKFAIMNREQEREESKGIVSKFTARFGTNKNTWEEPAKRIVTIMKLCVHGCSDEGAMMIMGGVLKGLLDDVRFDISGKQIWKSLPAKSTVGSWEIETATDCLFGFCWELRLAGVTQLALTTDHRHRKGQNHLVKLLSFPQLTDTGELTIGNICLDVDSGGHTTNDAANAIAHSMNHFLNILQTFVSEDVKISAITGDAGGGASVQNLHPALIKREVMGNDSKRLSCDMHNFNKAFEIACTDTWGGQGIGHNTVFQASYLFLRIIKHVRNEYSRTLCHDAWGMTTHRLRTDPVWQFKAHQRCNLAFESYMNWLLSLEGGDRDDIDAAVKIANCAPTDLQEPL